MEILQYFCVKESKIATKQDKTKEKRKKHAEQLTGDRSY